MKNIIEKVKRVLSNYKIENVYFRETEKKLISNFLELENPILHITGCSGTGKTCTVLYMTRNLKIKYLNYFHDIKLGIALKKIILLSKSDQIDLVILDEFDKYFTNKKKECLKYLDLLEKSKIKVITISNDTKFGNFRFSSYSSKQMIKIIKSKIESEVEQVVITNNALEFICKKFEKSGDLRLTQKYIFEILSKKEKLPIEIKDLIIKKDLIEEKNIQHLIIKNMVEKEIFNYQIYLEKCNEKFIPKLSKLEFETVFEYYKLE